MSNNISVNSASNLIVQTEPTIVCQNGITIDFSGVVGKDGSIDVTGAYGKIKQAAMILETINIKSPTTHFVAK